MPRRARLLAKTSAGVRRKEVHLTGRPVAIGRSERNHVVLDDESVSKHHAEVRVADDGHWWLADLGSSNGTLVNGYLVNAPHRLAEGDEVEFGRVLYQYTETAPPTRVHITQAGSIGRTSVLATSVVESFVASDSVQDLNTMRRLFERTRTALDAVRRTVSTTDPERLGRQILDVTFELVSADAGAFLLLGDDGTPVPVASRSPRGADFDVVVSRTLVDQAAKSKTSVLATDALMDRRLSASESIVAAGMRSIMCVPLVYEGTAYGVLHVSNTMRASAFSEDDLELLSGIGEGAAVALANAMMSQRLAEEQRQRSMLGRFLSPLVLDRVMQGPGGLQRGGDEAVVTVMFADIRGFTRLTEQTAPNEVVEMLNDYFDAMVDAVFEHEGMLDKYIGDALMAIWGRPESRRDDAQRAVAAAFEMRRALRLLNQRRSERGRAPIQIGIGLATGPCVAGAMGARRRLEFTVIGDAVNLAARLAGLAEPGQILVDRETKSRIREAGVQLPPTEVKGKQRAVTIYSLPGGA
ncbi:MAG: adenylate/guanylate cyclase domain-containing protein [Myxococcota bacterium]